MIVEEVHRILLHLLLNDLECLHYSRCVPDNCIKDSAKLIICRFRRD